MRDPNKVRQSESVSARPDEERDLRAGTGDAKKDGYTAISHRPRHHNADWEDGASSSEDDRMRRFGWDWDI
jgi:hypothetical protein